MLRRNDSVSPLDYGACVVVCLVLLAHSVAFAAQAENRVTKKKSDEAAFQFSKDEPIFISSNWMEADRKKNTITYKGQVVAVQAEMTMRSETLTAHYTPDMKQLKEVVAEGKVHVTQRDRVATAARAVFKDQTITLTGDPVVRQGNNQISGSRIIFFIEEDRAVAEGGTQQRVKATIFPEELGRREKKAAGSAGER